jgi:hypothetical protein
MSPAVVLVLALFPLLSFGLGYWIGHTTRSSDSAAPSRAELRSYRRLVNELTASAAEHALLGDNYAVIALDKINRQQREIQ